MYFILMHRHDPDAEWQPDFSVTYPTPQEATETAKARNTSNTMYKLPTRYRVRKVVDTDDDNFFAREEKLNHTPIPWETNMARHGYKYMLPHIDPTNERHVRFFRSIEDAVCQKYTSMLMSRFLTNYEGFDEDEAQTILIKNGFYKDQDFGITNDPEKIIDIYTNGPSSCMNDPEEYELPEPHPAIVYSEGDFAVAYIGGEGSYSSRAVVCKTLKKYYCIYGHTPLMEDHLKKAGYEYMSSYDHGKGYRYNGMKVKLIEGDGGYLMPYIDFAEYGRITPDGLYMEFGDCYEWPFCVRSTSGYAEEE